MSLALPDSDTVTTLWNDHERVILEMSEQQLLAMGHELKAAQIRYEYLRKTGLALTRLESLEAVFAGRDYPSFGEVLKKTDTEIALWNEHENVIMGMTEDRLLVMARELMAARMIQVLQFKKEDPIILTRQEALEATLTAEAMAREAGGKPKVDFFLPIDNDFMEVIAP